eukprot:GHRR01019409.1.p1 GENE.GHRR01019409.1~~GHRR01019409.1.p1  ORF type:complete len:119 (+),score=30.96 GHRR01019409.1:816-1172(+)
MPASIAACIDACCAAAAAALLGPAAKACSSTIALPAVKWPFAGSIMPSEKRTSPLPSDTLQEDASGFPPNLTVTLMWLSALLKAYSRSVLRSPPLSSTTSPAGPTCHCSEERYGQQRL